MKDHDFPRLCNKLPEGKSTSACRSFESVAIGPEGELERVIPIAVRTVLRLLALELSTMW